MDAHEYQKLAARTLIDKPPRTYTDQEIMLVWCTLGICGEAGEIAELVKKGVFHDHGLDVAKLMKEVGDEMWYLCGALTTLKASLNDCLEGNIEKLRARYPSGFTTEASKNWEATR